MLSAQGLRRAPAPAKRACRAVHCCCSLQLPVERMEINVCWYVSPQTVSRHSHARQDDSCIPASALQLPDAALLARHAAAGRAAAKPALHPGLNPEQQNTQPSRYHSLIPCTLPRQMCPASALTSNPVPAHTRVSMPAGRAAHAQIACKRLLTSPSAAPEPAAGQLQPLLMQRAFRV